MLLFFLFFLPFSSGETWRMVLTYGEPVNMAPLENYETSWEQCYSICYWMEECGFPLDQCPSRSAINGSDSWDVNGVAFINRITTNGTYWATTYSTFQCDNETKLFRRGSYHVCVGVRLLTSPDCGTFRRASELCKTYGWLSITGPCVFEELYYFLSKRIARTARSTVLWVDGYKSQFSDFTLNGYPDSLFCKYHGENMCLYIGHLKCQLISPADCIQHDDGSYCWQGAACLKKYVDVS